MKSLLLILISAIMISSCGRKADEAEHTEEAEHHDEAKTEVVLTHEQFEAINVQLGQVEQRNLTDVLKASGFLKVPPQNKANITAAMGGTVQSIAVQEGDYVKRGQTVAVLSNPEFISIQQEYLNAKAQLVFAEAEYNRQKTLVESNVSAQKTFQQAESNYNSLKATLNGLKQKLMLLGINAASLTAESISSTISVRSPISGNISHVDINIGATPGPSDELMDVVDNSQLHLDLFVFEQDLGKIKVGQVVDVSLTNLPGRQYTAKVFAIGSAFEGESKSIPVHASIVGDKTGLIEGMNVTALVSIADNVSDAVPTSAIVSNAGNDFIFIRAEEHEEEAHGHGEEEEGHEHGEEEAHQYGEEEQAHGESVGEFVFRRVQVKAGVTDGGFTQITPLEEIPESAQVVVNGAFYLMAMLTNAGEEGHSH